MERHTLDPGLVRIDANGAPDLQLGRLTVSNHFAPHAASLLFTYLTGAGLPGASK